MGVCGQYVLMQTLFMNRIEDFMKKIFRQIHLWLSVPFGLIISLICFSGAMLVFENEVMELVRHELYYVKKVETVSLPVDRLLEEVELTLPDSVSVTGINVFSDTYNHFSPEGSAIRFHTVQQPAMQPEHSHKKCRTFIFTFNLTSILIHIHGSTAGRCSWWGDPAWGERRRPIRKECFSFFVLCLLATSL